MIVLIISVALCWVACAFTQPKVGTRTRVDGVTGTVTES